MRDNAYHDRRVNDTTVNVCAMSYFYYKNLKLKSNITL